MQKHKTLFEMWEKTQSNIRILCLDLRDNSMDDVSEAEIEADNSRLVHQENSLAVESGLKHMDVLDRLDAVN